MGADDGLEARAFAPELTVLLALDRPEVLGEVLSTADVSTTLALAHEHRLLGRLATALGPAVPKADTSDDMEPSWASTTHERERTRLAFEGELLPQLEHACRALVDAGVVPTVLKGAALVVGGFVPAGERAMVDVDLLVPREQFREAQVALEAAGYRARVPAGIRDRARTRHYQDAPLFHPDHRASLDLHHHLQHPAHRHPFDVRTLTHVPLRLPSGIEVRRLSDPDLAAHIALHLWRDRAAGRPAALGQLWDLRDVTGRLDPPGWAQLADASRRRGHARVVGAGVALTHLLLGAPLPPQFPEVADLASDDRLHAFALTRVLAPRPEHIQLLMVTPDVDLTPWRVMTRVLAILRLPQERLAAAYPTTSPSRLRHRHIRHVARLLARSARRPLLTRLELAQDRWAHDLH